VVVDQLCILADMVLLHGQYLHMHMIVPIFILEILVVEQVLHLLVEAVEALAQEEEVDQEALVVVVALEKQIALLEHQ
jgi:hypothetical protein